MRMFNGSVALEEEFIQARIDEEYSHREEEYQAFLRAQEEEYYKTMEEAYYEERNPNKDSQ